MVLDSSCQEHVTTTGTIDYQDFPDDSPQALTESLVQWVSAEMGQDVVARALDEFHVATGKFFHDDPFYETRTCYFLDHLAYEWRLPDGKTPFETRPAFGVKEVQHSLFDILRASEKRLVIQDLLRGSKHVVEAVGDEIFTGLVRKTLFQGFLFVRESGTRLSRSLIFHPAQAARIIRKSVAKARKEPSLDPRVLLCRLARQQLRHLRHRHVDPRQIYLADPR